MLTGDIAVRLSDSSAGFVTVTKATSSKLRLQGIFRPSSIAGAGYHDGDRQEVSFR